MQQLIGRIEAVAGRADLTLTAGERALKEIRSALASVPQLPSKKDYDEVVKRLKVVQTALMPKVQELRDVADWQRWANVGIQEQLCEKMEALATVEDPEEIAKQVRELQQQWQQAVDVPRAQSEALWKRFKTAHDEAWSRCEAHFAAQAEERGGNLAKKIALCERAEALADSTNWIQTADEIKKLQAEWKTIGAVSRGQEKSIWERFRSACDRFFTRRHADLAERKTVWADNLTKKEALCVKAEALRDSTEWDAAASEMKRLQAEWKTIGPVKKSRSEAMWQRFRGAADHFFARYTQRHDIALGERVAAREAVCAELEALAPVPNRAGSRAPGRLDGDGARAARALAGRDRRARRRPRSRAGSRRSLRQGVRRRDHALAGGVRRNGSGSRREPQEDGDDRRPDRNAREVARRAGIGRRRRGAVADRAHGGDAEGSARRQHHRRQDRRRQPVPRRGRRRAPGANRVVADRPGARSGAALARRSVPARHPPHCRRDAEGYEPILISSTSNTSMPYGAFLPS